MNRRCCGPAHIPEEESQLAQGKISIRPVTATTPVLQSQVDERDVELCYLSDCAVSYQKLGGGGMVWTISWQILFMWHKI